MSEIDIPRSEVPPVDIIRLTSDPGAGAPSYGTSTIDRPSPLAFHAAAEKKWSEHKRYCNVPEEWCEQKTARDVAYEEYTKRPHPSTLKGRSA